MGFGGFGGGFDFNKDGKMNPAESMAEMNFVTGEEYDSDYDQEDYDGIDDYGSTSGHYKGKELYNATPIQRSKLLMCKSEYENLILSNLVKKDYEKSFLDFYNGLRELEMHTDLVNGNEEYYTILNALNLYGLRLLIAESNIEEVEAENEFIKQHKICKMEMVDKNFNEIKGDKEKLELYKNISSPKSGWPDMIYRSAVKANEKEEIGLFWILIIRESFMFNKYESLFKTMINYSTYFLSFAEYLSDKYAKVNIWEKALIYIEELRKKFILYSENIQEKQIVEGEDEVDATVSCAWDDNIEKLLNFMKISWEFKSETVYLSNGEKFVPEFVLEDKSIICNLNSWKSAKWKQLNAFQVLYPKRKVIAIDSDIYLLLNEKFGKKVPGWQQEEVTPFNETIQIVGIGFEAREKYVNQLVVGDELELIREPDNNFDKNAIKVNDKFGNQVGYVSREWASILAGKIDDKCKYKMTVIEKKEKSIECKAELMNVYVLEVPEVFKWS